MLKQPFSPLPLLLIIFFLHCPQVFAQSPAQAPAPAPAGPPNITAILDKAGNFSTLIRLLRRTKMDSQIYTQLNDSNQMTIFAPTDDAFSTLRSVNLNSFTDLQRIQLIQFHVIPSFISFSEFQTTSNPLNTQAGDNTDGGFPLNVTTSENQVNISTGIVNTTVSGTIYTDNQLAVYQVDQVLVPLRFYGPPSPAPAPSKPEKVAAPPLSKSSGAVLVIRDALNAVSLVGSVIAAFSLSLSWRAG